MIANNTIKQNEIYIIKDKKITTEQLPQVVYYNYQLGSSATQSEMITMINTIAALFGAIPYETPVYEYTINVDEETNISSITITGLADTTKTELEIPTIIQRLPVTTIDTTVTATTNPEYNNISSLSVYDNITDIGTSFKNAKNLTDVTINIPVTDSITYNLRARTVNGIIELKADAFSGCEKLSAFNGGNSITSIGPSAFANTKLTQFPTPNITSVPEYAFYNVPLSGDLTLSNCESIGQQAFYGKNKLETIEILEPCESIGPSAFYVSGNTTLNSIKLPSTIKSIGRCAFDYLTYVSNDFDFSTFNNLEIIDSWAFAQCKLVSAINLPLNGKLTAINEGAFYNCNNISSIIIPKSVKSIGPSAFYTNNIKKLQELDIGGSSLTSVGTNAFGTSCNITELTVGNIAALSNTYLNGTYVSTTLKKLVIDDTCSALLSDSFKNWSTITSLTLGKNIQSIGSGAFFRLSNQVDPIIIPKSVSSIGVSAFFDNYNVSSLTYEAGCQISSIPNAAFSYCKNLTAINFPENVQSLGISAYCNCSVVTSLNIPSSITSVGNYCFQNNKLQSISAYNNFPAISSIVTQAKSTLSNLNIYNINDSKFSIANSLFYNWTTLKDIHFDPVVTSIGASAFYNCTTLTSITIPNSVTSIGTLGFYNCTALTSITIPESLTTINQTVFMNCQKLVEINLPSTLTTIGLSAFRQCYALTSINLPSSLTTIQANAFMQCNSLKSITFDKTMSQVSSMGNKYWGIPSGAQISCTDGVITVTGTSTGTMEEYPNLANTHVKYIDNTLSSYDIVGTISGDMLGLPTIQISQVHNIIDISVGTDVSSIDEYAFYNCLALTSITIPESLINIGKYAFANCSSLASLSLPSSLTSIGIRAFNNCPTTCQITFNKTMSDVSSMSDKYWGIKNNTQISCTDGIIIVTDTNYEPDGPA